MSANKYHHTLLRVDIVACDGHWSAIDNELKTDTFQHWWPHGQHAYFLPHPGRERAAAEYLERTLKRPAEILLLRAQDESYEDDQAWKKLENFFKGRRKTPPFKVVSSGTLRAQRTSATQPRRQPRLSSINLTCV